MSSAVNIVKAGSVEIGARGSLVLLAGPCVIEGLERTMYIGQEIKKITDKLGIPYVFKASYDKANRSSYLSPRGPGIEEGLKILQTIKENLSVPVVSDIHSVEDVAPAAQVLDILQIPAFLCRQTDLVYAAGKTGKVVNVKKGQFLAPNDMRHVVNKIKESGNENILLTERGTTFGYNNLVVDMRSLSQMRALGVPVVFDATHSVQLPGGAGDITGGQREFVPVLARAAAAVGIDALFLEVHDNPPEGLSDSTNMLYLDKLEELLVEVLAINEVAKSYKG